ncbi:hypothetical protein T484DRAFT_2755459 [Baffinella frigidus]|nr:hypothetical protein T484DRAFT_2755459 [Cryptophyta sp. CCMP2293]
MMSLDRAGVYEVSSHQEQDVPEIDIFGTTGVPWTKQGSSLGSAKREAPATSGPKSRTRGGGRGEALSAIQTYVVRQSGAHVAFSGHLALGAFLPPALRQDTSDLDLVVLKGDGVAASLFAGALRTHCAETLLGAWEHTTTFASQGGPGGGAGLERRVLHEIVGEEVSVKIDHARHSAAQDAPTRWPSTLPKGALVMPLVLLVRDIAARLHAKDASSTEVDANRMTIQRALLAHRLGLLDGCSLPEDQLFPAPLLSSLLSELGLPRLEQAVCSPEPKAKKHRGDKVMASTSPEELRRNVSLPSMTAHEKAQHVPHTIPPELLPRRGNPRSDSPTSSIDSFDIFEASGGDCPPFDIFFFPPPASRLSSSATLPWGRRTSKNDGSKSAGNSHPAGNPQTPGTLLPSSASPHIPSGSSPEDPGGASSETSLGLGLGRPLPLAGFGSFAGAQGRGGGDASGRGGGFAELHHHPTAPTGLPPAPGIPLWGAAASFPQDVAISHDAPFSQNNALFSQFNPPSGRDEPPQVVWGGPPEAAGLMDVITGLDLRRLEGHQNPLALTFGGPSWATAGFAAEPVVNGFAGDTTPCKVTPAILHGDPQSFGGGWPPALNASFQGDARAPRPQAVWR